MNNYKKIRNSSLFMEMRFFLKYCGISEEAFLNSVFSKNALAIDIMCTLHHFGFIGIIIPTNELLEIHLDETTRLWWNEALSSMEHSKDIAEITDKFHRLINEAEISFNHVSNATLQTYIWESYPANKAEFIQNDLQWQIGILLPGRFNINNEYLSLMAQYGLPALYSFANQEENLMHEDPYRNSIIQKSSYDYVSELTIKYVPYLQSRANELFNLSENELEQIRPNDFRDMIMKNAEKCYVPTQITLDLIEKLRTLINIYYKFNPNANDRRLISQVLAILMQCAGLNSDASELLISTIEKLDTIEKSSVLLLMGLYRALSLERNMYRTKLFELAKSIFAQKKLPDEAVWITKDICNFFCAYSDDITNRFNEEKLLKMIEQSDERNRFFYSKYLFELRNNCIDNSIKWVSKNLFESKTIPSFFNHLLVQINNPDNSYTQKLLAFSTVSTLFHAMFSHEDTNPRLLRNECIQLLNLDEPQTCSNHEIFDLYSPRQIDLLRNYAVKLFKANRQIPSTNAVIKYERISFAENYNLERICKLESIVYEHEEKLSDLETKIYLVKNHLRIINGLTNTNDNKLSELIIESFKNNPDDAKMFYNEIHKLYNTEGNASNNTLQKIFKFAQLTTSHETSTIMQVISNELSEILENFIQLCPKLNNILCCMNIINSLNKILDTVTQRLNQNKHKH